MEIKLTGWKAIVASVVVIGFLGFKFNMQTESLQTEGIDEIKKWLQMESTRAVLPDMQKLWKRPDKTRNTSRRWLTAYKKRTLR